MEITTARWIARHAHPLTTLEPDAPGTDLEPLREMVGDARVVTLGVSARDTHELAVVSQRILKFLVEELGFRSLALEGDDETSILLDQYVRTGTGDPRALLADARSFWRTAELLDTIHWIRRHNERQPAEPVRIANLAEHPRKVAPHGGDLGHIERLLAENALWWQEHTGHKTVYWGGMAHTVNGDPRIVSAAAAPLAVHRSAGSYLRESLGSGHLSVGLTFHHGAESHLAPAPPAEFAEATLGEAEVNAYVLDLRSESPAEVRAWLDRPATTRLIGPVYDPGNDAAFTLSGGSLSTWFDLLVHCPQVTPARPLPRRGTPHDRRTRIG
ncbi:erythromycin esterase family protein [Amycolatopsis sp. H20-H5]|uniref:erythromycin esterase family protein n=1 Tax=Amycolatopsis sp. H20-H5 TaxID=3046309 RepID=UPI002DBFBAD4|nr:erythromycin esterase family protein [Amycolatopsis sp. H20-H5]MEC3977841.1 erythromycin esterase family protein [Amycolatopsis sp. H20-H5]